MLMHQETIKHQDVTLGLGRVNKGKILETVS